MREILFRGKAINTNDEELLGKWIFGQLVVRRDHDEGEEKTFICESGYRFIRCLNKMPRTYEVDPETVGQYTGLTDKNGKRIFEGDVFLHDNKYLHEVIWNDEQKGFYASGIDFLDDDCMGNFYESNIEVIGNIHDNPELIQGVE